MSVSATPTRADGRLMSGEIVCTYPIYRAIQHGFVKHVKGLVLNPRRSATSAVRTGARSRSTLRKCVASVMFWRVVGAEDAYCLSGWLVRGVS